MQSSDITSITDEIRIHANLASKFQNLVKKQNKTKKKQKQKQKQKTKTKTKKKQTNKQKIQKIQNKTKQTK